MSSDPYRTITYQVADGIATVTLNRPARLNAFTTTMGRELVAAYETADSDDAVRAVILTGSGRGFCAGADLQLGAQSFDADVATKDSLPPKRPPSAVYRETGEASSPWRSPPAESSRSLRSMGPPWGSASR